MCLGKLCYQKSVYSHAISVSREKCSRFSECLFGVQCQGPANHGSASCLPSGFCKGVPVLGARFGNATLRLGRARTLLLEPLSTRSGSNGFKRRDGLLLGASENLISARPGVQVPAGSFPDLPGNYPVRLVPFPVKASKNSLLISSDVESDLEDIRQILDPSIRQIG
jgi:hypothetical protein